MDTDPTLGVFFMARHDEQLKLKVVKRYLAGGIGYRDLAREYGVARTLARQWVTQYELHGKQGLRRKGHTKYSAEFKLAALERMRRDNLSQAQVQAILGIRDPGAIGRWERQYHEGGLSALSPRPKGRPRKMPKSLPPEPIPPASEPDERTREQLLKENEYLRAEVAYLKKLDA
ncbi:transposase, partial [Cupriavidus necator]|nr:transposase [Cupriavidus necator]